MTNWVEACRAGDIAEEDVMRFDHRDQTYAVYRSADDRYFATEGECTHAKVHLADGLVIGEIIECPLHNGRFNYPTGAARGAPACEALRTYPVKVENGAVLVDVG